MKALLLGLLCLLTACSAPTKKREQSLQEARQAGFQHHVITRDGISTHVWSRGLSSDVQTVHVYIEGDGRAFVRRNRVSSDPTPKHAIGLRLALQDPTSAVIYLGRPCQFEQQAPVSKCHPEYWTYGRYSQLMLDHLQQALTAVLAEHRLEVVKRRYLGHSGGGVMAMLMAAAQPATATGVVAVAAPLDITAWTRHHGDTPLSSSLNPVDYVDKLAQIPQLVWVGAQDKVVPVSVVKSYLAKSHQHGKKLRFISHPQADHLCCWEQGWREFMHKYAVDE